MTFKVIRKLNVLADVSVITDHNLGTDATTEWTTSAVTTGDLRKVTTTANGASVATYAIYEALQGHSNQDPTLDVSTVSPGVGTYWKEVGAVNEYAWANNVAQDKSVKAGSFYIECTPGIRVDSVALVNAVGTSFNITAVSATYGEVFNEDYNLIQPRGLGSYWAYCYEPIVTIKNIAEVAIPAYSDNVITVTLTASSGNAEAGAIIFGQSLDIGIAINGTSFSFEDFSKVNYVPELARTIITERDYREEAGIDVMIERARFPYLKQELIALRNVVSYWLPNPSDQGTGIMGILEDYTIPLRSAEYLLANLQLKGVV